MSAPTYIGTQKGIYGISQTQTGLVFEEITYEYSNKQLPFPNQDGETVSMTCYDESVGIKMSALVASGTAFGGTIASALTLSSAIPSYLKGSVSGGTTIIDKIFIKDGINSLRSLDLECTLWPKIS